MVIDREKGADPRLQHAGACLNLSPFLVPNGLNAVIYAARDVVQDGVDLRVFQCKGIARQSLHLCAPGIIIKFTGVLLRFPLVNAR